MITINCFMKKIVTTFLLLQISFFSVFSQVSLTLEEAVSMALENNYAIGVARVQSSIAEDRNNIGSAGALPSLVVNAATSSSNSVTSQEYFIGPSVNNQRAASSILNGNAVLNWTIFDGLKMFATKAQLNELEEEGALNLKIEIENTIVKITTSYFDVVRQQQLIKAAKDAIKIHRQRLKAARLRFDIGSISKMDLLLAKVDLNAQKSVLLKLKNELNNAKVTLNQLLGKDLDSDFIAKDKIVVNYKPIYKDIRLRVIDNNYQLLSAKNTVKLSASSLRQKNSLRLPNVDVNATYNFGQIKNQVGVVLLNKYTGLNLGLSASWVIFDGFKNNREVKTSKFMVEQSKLKFEQVTSEVEASLLKAFKSYLNLLEILKLEEENIGVAKESVNYALKRFKIGSTNTIDLMTAQQKYEDAFSRLIDARYNAKLAETELKRLEGTLVK